MQPESLGLEKRCGVGGSGQCRWPSLASISQLMQREGLHLPVSCIIEEVQFHENLVIFFCPQRAKCFSSLYLRVASNLLYS